MAASSTPVSHFTRFKQSHREVRIEITTNLLWSYEYQKYRLALNVYNLFDKVTY